MSKERLRVIGFADSKLAVQLETSDGEVISRGTYGELEHGESIPNNAELLETQLTTEVGVFEVVSRTKIGPSMVSSPAYRAGYDRIKWN